MGPYPRVKGVSCMYSCLCPEHGDTQEHLASVVKTQQGTSQLWATILNRLLLSASVFSAVTWPEYSAHKTPIGYYMRSVQSCTGHPFRVTPMPVFRDDGWGGKFNQNSFMCLKPFTFLLYEFETRLSDLCSSSSLANLPLFLPFT